MSLRNIVDVEIEALHDFARISGMGWTGLKNHGKHGEPRFCNAMISILFLLEDCKKPLFPMICVVSEESQA